MTSLEELRAENDRLKHDLDAIELTKAKKEQEQLKAQLEERKKQELEEHDKQLIAKVKAELGVGVQSKASETPQQSSTRQKSGWEQYAESYTQRKQVKTPRFKGRSYQQLLEDMMMERAV